MGPIPIIKNLTEEDTQLTPSELDRGRHPVKI